MTENEELFRHDPKQWTVGQLRQAMEGMADDLPLEVVVPPRPGGVAESRVVVHAGLNAVTGARTSTPGDGHVDEMRKGLLIECDYAPGAYFRRRE